MCFYGGRLNSVWAVILLEFVAKLILLHVDLFLLLVFNLDAMFSYVIF